MRPIRECARHLARSGVKADGWTRTRRWTAGTQMEALLELDYPTLSVFAAASYPPPSTADAPSAVTAIVRQWASQRGSSDQLAYVAGGAAADPAALGVGWLVAAAFADSSTESTYVAQAKQQVSYLLDSVPTTPDGAISHRPSGEPVQLWADFISMVHLNSTLNGTQLGRG